MVRNYATKDVLTPRQAEAVLAKLIYSVEGIADCRMDRDTQTIAIDAHEAADCAAIDRAVERLIGMERHNRLVGARVYKRSGSEPAGLAGSKTASRGLIEPDGSVRRDMAVTLIAQVDRLFVDMSLRHRARLRQYPSMIPVDTLKKCNYIGAFPQNVHLVAEFPHRLESLEKVRTVERYDEVARISPFALSPAVCFHCYAELSGSRLFEPLALTARGTCYRHEAPWRIGDHRLNEFGMRETVLFGDAAYIEQSRMRFMDEVWELFEALGMSGRLETASDPFYYSEESGKAQQQLMGNMKYELIVDGGEEAGSFAIASFNNMDTSLSKPFEVMDDAGNALHSGCIAFGLDRWVYALLAYHGTDYGKWPTKAKRLLDM